MACMWIAGQHVNRAFNFIQDAVGGIHAVLGNKFPNVIQIGECVRMK